MSKSADAPQRPAFTLATCSPAGHLTMAAASLPVRRALAIFGLLALAAQVALGSAGALFLCLCQPEGAHESPCQPPPAGGIESVACQHDVDDAAEASAEDDCGGCNDVLLDGSDVDSLARLAELSLVKAPLICWDARFGRLVAPRELAAAARAAFPQTAPPERSSALHRFAQTVRLQR